jgi:hypothetical protein
MLSGLENIPRLTELKEIQNQYKANHQDSIAGVRQSGSDIISVSEGTGISSNVGISTKRGAPKVKDETLILPLTAHKRKESPLGDSGRFSDRADEDYPQGIVKPRPALRRKISSEPESAEIKAPRPITKSQIVEEAIPQLPAGEMSTPNVPGSHAPRHRVVVAKDHADQTAQSAPRTTSHVSLVHGTPQGKKSSYAKDSRGFDEKHLPHTSDDRLRTKETERQIIERELQRQRMMAISGRTPKTGSGVSTHSTPSPEIVRFKREVTDKTSLNKDHEPSDPDEIVHQVHRKRTVIIQKKKVHPVTQDTPIPEDEKGEVSVEDDDLSVIKRPDVYSRQTDSEELKVSIKNSAYKSKDEIFEGKGIQRTTAPQVRDSSLIHTVLKSKKTLRESKNVESEPESSDHVTESSKAPKKREKNTTKKDDISWI